MELQSSKSSVTTEEKYPKYPTQSTLIKKENIHKIISLEGFFSVKDSVQRERKHHNLQEYVIEERNGITT